MALHEKNLPFKSQSVNLTKGEQYDPWFLQINPKGEVPVLRDGVRIIPDSSRILDYLEDNFSNGKFYFIFILYFSIFLIRSYYNIRNLYLKLFILYFTDFGFKF